MVTNCYDRIQTVRGHFKEFQGLGSCRGNRRLLGAVGGYRGLQGVTRGYRELQGVKGKYKGLQGVTRGYNGLQGVSGGNRGLKGVTRGFRELQRLQEVTRLRMGYKELQGATRG